MILRTVTVDDEPLALKRLKRLLLENPDVELAQECSSGAEALEAVQRHRPNLLILDVEMPAMNGFALVAALKALPIVPMPELIFKTAYPNFSLKAFEVAALDYLLKPTSRERLNESLTRVRMRLCKAPEDGPVPQIHSWLKRIPIRKGDRTIFIETERIHWIEAASNYVLVHAEGTSEIIRDTLGAFEKRLCPEQFTRINRSAIVRHSSIRQLRANASHEHFAQLVSGEELAITRGLKGLLQRMAKGL